MPDELRRGSTGEAVRDVQRRLAGAHFEVGPDEPGVFAGHTESAVRAFQQARGLRVDGIVGPQTWGALVESGWSLGDRLLYFRRPLLRGDDVAELQRRLNALGFDAGREDGILGDETAGALLDFQRNAGLATDAVCGPSTVAALGRMGSLAAGSVAEVREREQLRHAPGRLEGRRVYVMADPALAALGDAVTRGLLDGGADALLDASGADDSTVAGAANRYGADLFLGLRPGDAPGCRCAHFASGRFRSEAGFRIATAVRDALGAVLPGPGLVCGRAYSLLRETRMAAVVCEPVEAGDVDAMRGLVARTGDVTRAIVAGVRRGVERPPPDDGS